jgi:3-methyladenine DNA glycosylase/8-oxoguanine DNA glycosylase
VEDWASFCRSRLLNFVANLSDDDVRTASRKAFAALPNLKEAIAHLSTLKGVGPATASAVLAAHMPSIVPFMSDEAMVAALGGVKDYSMKVYLLFAEKLQVKSKVKMSLSSDVI